MRQLSFWVLVAGIGGAAAAVAQSAPDNARGQILYATHCGSCHTSQVHWRDKTLASDWTSLRAQVLRWQANAGLAWSDEDIVAVTRYLNDLYYRFPVPTAPVAQRSSARGG
jgi:mono/diheme cytochrome c family protein